MKGLRTGKGTMWDATIPFEKRVIIDRVQRRFRQHVQTRSNPNGRIHRECCQFCRNVPAGPDVEFHHLDYERPFVGTWVCLSCHRKIEKGSLKVTAKRLFNYESLVEPILRKGGWHEVKAERAAFDPSMFEESAA